MINGNKIEQDASFVTGNTPKRITETNRETPKKVIDKLKFKSYRSEDSKRKFIDQFLLSKDSDTRNFKCRPDKNLGLLNREYSADSRKTLLNKKSKISTNNSNHNRFKIDLKNKENK